MTLKAERPYPIYQENRHEKARGFSLPFDRPLFYLSFLVGIVLIVCTVWFLFRDDDNSSDVNIRVIKADEDPYKVKVEEAAVDSIPFQDKLVYNRIHPSGPVDQNAEHLLPEPEAPIKFEAVEESRTSAVSRETESQKEKEVVQVAISNPPGTVNAANSASVEIEKEIIEELSMENTKVDDKVVSPSDGGESSKTVASIDDLLSGVVDEQAPAPAAVVSDPGGIYVQLATIDDEAQANSEWKRFKRMAPDLLGAKEPIVQAVNLEDKGPVYRLRVGPYDTLDKAKADCTILKDKKVSCIVIR